MTTIDDIPVTTDPAPYETVTVDADHVSLVLGTDLVSVTTVPLTDYTDFDRNNLPAPLYQVEITDPEDPFAQPEIIGVNDLIRQSGEIMYVNDTDPANHMVHRITRDTPVPGHLRDYLGNIWTPAELRFYLPRR